MDELGGRFTWDKTKEGDYRGNCVSYTLDEAGVFPISKMKSWRVQLILATSSVKHYFKQQKYIEGTYIRKDKFSQMLERKHNKVIINLDFLPIIPTEDFIKEWRRYIKEVGIMFIDTSRK